MNFKNRKFIEIICFLLVIMAFVIIGYYTYQSYSKQKEEKVSTVKVDNYYNVEYLFNNDYIKIANTIEDFKEEDKDLYMYLDKENTLYVKCTNGKTILNKRVTELPDGNITVYYNNLYDDYYEFAALLESKELYYVAFNINSKSNYKFKKVGEDITSVYVPTYDKNEVFVNRNNRFVTNFIFIEGDNNLDYLSYKNKEYSLNNSLQEVKPYFDYVCASDNFKICNDIMIYQTFEKKLVYGYSGNTIKNEFGEEIIVKDMFSIFEVNTKKDVNLDEISFRTLNKKYDYLFTVYVVSEEGVLYKLEINNNVMKKEGNISALTASDKKVKQLNYEEKDGEIGKIHIIYNDGKEEVILFSRNKSIITSTVYDKEKLKNKVLKVG